jgi:hypothetical protein
VNETLQSVTARGQLLQAVPQNASCLPQSENILAKDIQDTNGDKQHQFNSLLYMLCKTTHVTKPLQGTGVCMQYDLKYKSDAKRS